MTNDVITPSKTYISNFEEYTFYPVTDFESCRDRSGLLLLFAENRIVYISGSKNISQKLYNVFGSGGTSSIKNDFLFPYIDKYSFIEINPYSRAACDHLKQALLEKWRPVLNCLYNEYQWYEKRRFYFMADLKKQLADEKAAYEALEKKYKNLTEKIQLVLKEDEN